MQRAEVHAAGPLYTAGKMGERNIEIGAGSVLRIISAQTSHSCTAFRAIVRHCAMSSSLKRRSQAWVVSPELIVACKKPIS